MARVSAKKKVKSAKKAPPTAVKKSAVVKKAPAKKVAAKKAPAKKVAAKKTPAKKVAAKKAPAKVEKEAAEKSTRESTAWQDTPEDIFWMSECDSEEFAIKTYDCPLCDEEHDVDDTETVTLPCCEKMICRDMMEGHILSKMQSMELPPICPLLPLRLCEARLPEHLCLEILSGRDRTTFSDAMQRTEFEKLGFQFCRAPNCKGVLDPSELGRYGTESRSKTHFVCPLNGSHQFCLACDVAWHKDESCEEYQRRTRTQSDQKRNEAVMLQRTLTAHGWKKCPNCGNGVEKQSGCRRMVCRCGANFCYSCGVVLNKASPYHGHYQGYGGVCRLWD